MSDDAPIPAEALNGDLLVLDLIYARTQLLRDAAAAGATVADGELMLLHQGAAAVPLWTGQAAPLELMQSKLAEARAGGLRSAEGEPSGSAADDAPERGNDRAAAGDGRAAEAAGDDAAADVTDASDGPDADAPTDGEPATAGT